MKNIDWRKELIDQAAHLIAGLVVCLLVHPATLTAAGFLTIGLWAVREHAQHGWHPTDGSWRDLVGWLAGTLLYVALVQ